MLGKLFKYDIKALSRILLPLFGATIVIGIINGLMLRYTSNNSINGVRIILLFLYFSFIAGTCIVSVVFSVKRFSDNILGKEGYLTNVLPVSPAKLIISKTLSATLWQVLTIIVVCVLSLIITMLISYAHFNPFETFKMFKDLFAFIGKLKTEHISMIFQIVGEMLFFCVLALLGIINTNLMFYASWAVGHTANSKKLLASFGAFVGFYTISQFINLLLINVYTIIFRMVDIQAINFSMDFKNFCLSMIPILILTLLYTAFYFFITKYFISKKLNLE